MDLDFSVALMNPSLDWGPHTLSDASVTNLTQRSTACVWQGNFLTSQSGISPDCMKECIYSFVTLRRRGGDDNFSTFQSINSVLSTASKFKVGVIKFLIPLPFGTVCLAFNTLLSPSSLMCFL